MSLCKYWTRCAMPQTMDFCTDNWKNCGHRDGWVATEPKKMMGIANKEELDVFLNEAMQNGQNCRAIKGTPPDGMTYSDGELINNDINIGWENIDTGKVFNLIYT